MFITALILSMSIGFKKINLENPLALSFSTGLHNVNHLIADPP
jgi:hypothetical protein